MSTDDLLNILKEAKRARETGVPIGIPEALFTQVSKRAREIAATLPYGDDIVVQGSRVEPVEGVLQPVIKQVPPIGPTTDLDVAIRVPERVFAEAIRRSFGTPNLRSAKFRTMQAAIGKGRISTGDARPNLRPVARAIEEVLGLARNKAQVTLVKIGGLFDSLPSIPMK